MSASAAYERFLDPAVLASIGRLDLIARTVVEGFLTGLHKSPYRGLSQEFAEHRPYIAGDELRRIDWRVYARTDRLYVKESEEETNAPVRLLLDVSASLGFAPRLGVSKLDYARYLTAALAYLSNRQGDRVGLVCFNEETQSSIPARGGLRHLQTILLALEGLEARGRTSIGPVLLRQASQWKRRGLAVLVSDLYDEPGEVVEAIARVRRARHDVIVFHLLDRAEKLLEPHGTYEFHDLETNETLLADTDRVRRAYVAEMDELRAYFRRELERAGADYVELDSAEPLDKALATYLRRRKAGRTKGKR
ncbi:MAG TPA: DUF58 domain-containing protein [Pyrinomonadaceae bacterium]|nr:DUF58 domain-containing protein [Pyrinomonadaceae bacterium]